MKEMEITKGLQRLMVIMDKYELEEIPFYSPANSQITAFHCLSRHISPSSLTVIRYELATSQAQFSKKLDAVLSTPLKYAKRKMGLEVVEIDIDLRKSPEQFTVFHIVDTQNEAELLDYLQKALLQLADSAHIEPGSRQGDAEQYEIESKTFCENEDGSVCLFKGVGSPVTVKRQEFSLLRYSTDLAKELAKSLNAGLAQARVQHPHNCRLLAMHLDTSQAPALYHLDHVLEALERNVEMEIQASGQRRLSEWELCEFLRQTTSALAYAHANVRFTQGVAHRDIRPENVFIDTKGDYKLGNFEGRIKTSEPPKTKKQAYLSPQQRGTYDPFKADVFALGMTLYALASLTFPDEWPTHTLEKKAKTMVVSLSCSQPLKRLLGSMFSEREQDRPSLQAVLECAMKPQVQKACAAVETGKYDKALEMLQTYRTELGGVESAALCVELGKVYSHFGQWAEAEEMVQLGLKLQCIDSTSQLAIVLAEIQYQQGLWADCISTCELLLQAEKRSECILDLQMAVYYLARAHDCLADGLGSAVVSQWSKLLLNDSVAAQCLSLFIRAGRLYVEGNWRLATKNYVDGLELAWQAFPHCLFTACSMLDLGCLYRQQNLLAKAESLYMQCRYLCETHYPLSCLVPLYLSNLGTLYRDSNRPEQAEQLLLQARDFYLDHFPDSELLPEYISYLALLYEDSKQPDLAELCYSQATDHYHTESIGLVNCLMHLGVLHYDSGRVEQAERCWTQVVDLTHSHFPLSTQLPDSLSYLGQLYTSQGRMQEAGERLRRAGQAYTLLGQQEKAAECNKLIRSL